MSSMATSGDSAVGDLSERQIGIVVLIAVVAVGAAGALALHTLEVPYGLYAGAAVGAVLGFLGVSYVLYGR